MVMTLKPPPPPAESNFDPFGNRIYFDSRAWDVMQRFYQMEFIDLNFVFPYPFIILLQGEICNFTLLWAVKGQEYIGLHKKLVLS